MRYPKILSCLLVATAGVTACKKAPAADAKKTTPAQQTAAQTPGQPAPAQNGQAAPGQPPAPQPVKPVPQQLPDVVARVNGEDVKKAAFEQMLKSMEMRAGQPIPPERRDEILRGALDQLVVFTLLTQESKNRHITVPDTEINQRIEQFRGQFPNQDAFEKALKARGMSMDTLKHDALVDLSVTKLMDAEMANQAIASDQE